MKNTQTLGINPQTGKKVREITSVIERFLKERLVPADQIEEIADTVSLWLIGTVDGLMEVPGLASIPMLREGKMNTDALKERIDDAKDGDFNSPAKQFSVLLGLTLLAENLKLDDLRQLGEGYLGQMENPIPDKPDNWFKAAQAYVEQMRGARIAR